MTVAALERFADPSRRCDESRIAGDRELEVWDLPGLKRDPADLVRRTPGALRDWLARDVPISVKRELLAASLRTRGARAGALARAPELWRRVRDGEVDRVACFSAKEFGLARALAAASGEQLEEQLARGTQYFGEFAFELLAVVPYAYWLHSRGQLEFTASTGDTRCLYYFSPGHEERPGLRRYVPITDYPAGAPGRFRYDRLGWPSELDTSRWLPPPYAEVYRDDRFAWPKEPCIVCNKATDERYLRRGVHVNAIETELLLSLIGRLRARYHVIYVRPRAADIVNDHQAVRELGDLEAVAREFPDVVLIQELQERHPELTFNELQLRVLASARRFVSVLGGPSYLASYFGGVNVVYARHGWETKADAYANWFHRFSGARVVAARTPAELLAAVDRELLAV